MHKTKIVPGSFFLLILFCLIASTVAAQTQPSPRMTAANELMQARKWAEAAKAYEEIVKDEPGNARAWYQLGMSRLSLEQFEPAIAALQKNIAIANNPNAIYNVACAYARLGQKEKALEWLSKAVNSQPPPLVNIAEDTDFAALREDARFKEIVTALDKKRRPCMYSPEAKQFDFWLGEWEVFNLQGQKTGTSVIQPIAAGCGILENWRDVFGGDGKSVNFYDSNASKWYQYWIGSNGGPQRYSGSYNDGAMRYEGEPATIKGVKTLSRLTFFNLDANTVRQFAEQSVDDGKTWTVGYDFKYVRKK
ncbi:MAG TPA: tetratricopeptide repeat protein [Pyrinomonadaceae bacterium]|jgi:tetratricopeptide (TPR) repeat protein|nr:tetratricopeptide repeat protein [Pyrinomonadaceae bacterium]